MPGPPAERGDNAPAGIVAVTIGECRTLGDRLMIRAQSMLQDDELRPDLRMAARSIWRLSLDMPPNATILLPSGEV